MEGSAAAAVADADLAVLYTVSAGNLFVVEVAAGSDGSIVPVLDLDLDLEDVFQRCHTDEGQVGPWTRC